jgi:hypothetical protein
MKNLIYNITLNDILIFDFICIFLLINHDMIIWIILMEVIINCYISINDLNHIFFTLYDIIILLLKNFYIFTNNSYCYKDKISRSQVCDNKNQTIWNMQTYIGSLLR